jgi:hypothetical protein
MMARARRKKAKQKTAAWNTVSRASVRLVKKDQRASPRLLVKPMAMRDWVMSSEDGEMLPGDRLKKRL